MLSHIRKLFPAVKQTKSKNNLETSFMSNPANSWVSSEPKLSRIIGPFLSSLPEAVQEYFTTFPLLILKSNGRLGCSLDIPYGHKVVLVFPDLEKKLRSSHFEQGLAILAHEMGHLYYEHSKKVIDPLEAQVLADSFAADLGLSYELMQIIEEHASGIEARVRLVYLNSKYIAAKKSNNSFN